MKFRRRILFLVPTFFLLISLFTLKDYGISWDEPIHFYRGQALLHYFLTGEKTFDSLPEIENHLPKSISLKYYALWGRRVVSDNSNRRSYYQNSGLTTEYFIKDDVGHPPLNDILAALTNFIFYQKLGLMGDIESHHLFNILASTVMVAVVSIFAYQKYGLLTGVIAGITVSLYPLFFSESHFNIKDPPQAAFFTLAIWAFWMSLKQFSWKWLLLSVVSCGVSLGMKFNILFIPFILLPYLMLIFGQLWKRRKLVPRAYLLVLTIAPFIVLAILLVPWVYLWQNPIGNFLKILHYYKDIGTKGLSEPFPRLFGFNLYPLIWIIVTTPPLVLIFFIIGTVFSLAKINKDDKTELLWLIWFVVVVGRVTLPGTNIYGGVRQIMEFLPPMVLLAVSFFDKLKRFITKRFTYGGVLLAMIFVAPQIWVVVKYHPNENVYFNSIIGGLTGAQQKNLSYWGNSFGNAYYQAINWINENAEKKPRLALVQGTGLNVPRIWLREDIDYWNGYFSGIYRKGEYLMELVYNNPIRVYPYSIDYVNTFLEPVYEVKVDGVAIARVWKNDLEHTKIPLKRIDRKIPVVIDKRNDGFLISLKEKRLLTRMELGFQKTKECSLPTGTVKSLVGGGSWRQEEEGLSIKQIGDTSSIDSDKLIYLFPAREADRLLITLDKPLCLKYLSTVAIYGI